jgi:hypothetical protein
MVPGLFYYSDKVKSSDDTESDLAAYWFNKGTISAPAPFFYPVGSHTPVDATASGQSPVDTILVTEADDDDLNGTLNHLETSHPLYNPYWVDIPENRILATLELHGTLIRKAENETTRSVRWAVGILFILIILMGAKSREFF